MWIPPWLWFSYDSTRQAQETVATMSAVKVYVMTDMEGVAGVVSSADYRAPTSEKV